MSNELKVPNILLGETEELYIEVLYRIDKFHIVCDISINRFVSFINWCLQPEDY